MYQIAKHTFYSVRVRREGGVWGGMEASYTLTKSGPS